MALMHQDGGNSGSTSMPGPRGLDISVKSYSTGIRVILWGNDGSMTVGMTNTTNGTTTFSLAAVDPTTLVVQSHWVPPLKGEVLNFAYMALNQHTHQIAITSKQGHMYVVQKEGDIKHPSFALRRNIDLGSGILKKGETLLNSMFDSDGNIWFTTGGLRAQAGFPEAPGDPVQNSSTIGYIEPNGAIHTYHLPDQMIENGIAISGTNVFCVTGPSGNADKANAIGYLFSFSPGPGNEITTNWQVQYDSGSARKPGAWCRGSGSTPVLLGNEFVAITDNADEQLHVLVYHQTAVCGQLLCSMPVFKPGAGNNDVGILVNEESGVFGLGVFNNFNATPLYVPEKDSINGKNWNDLSEIAAETVRLNVSVDGTTWGLAWETPICIPSVPILSTQTGLLYGYTQNMTESAEGKYEWYAVALDWRTGKEAWRVRTGAGGTFNDNYLPGSIGSDGSFFQGIFQGVVRIRDGSC